MSTSSLRILFLGVICFSGSYLSFAQKTTIKGMFLDENKQALEAVTVILISFPDSLPVAFDLTDSLGQFQMKDLSDGSYRLIASYLGYTSFSSAVVLTNDMTLDLGKIALEATAIGLHEIQITAKATPIIMRHDTIIYNASSFHTRQNAAVLELLKQLPGIEIDRDGNIKAQGKAVLNIMVDGKPFFGGDQATTTKVLPADAIQSVEVYGQKSLEATFTGVDDGQKERTINLILKEDRKKGWFGNGLISGGGSRLNDQRHDLSGNLNRFAPKYQFSAVGSVSNLPQRGASGGFNRSSSGGLSFYKTQNENNNAYGNYLFDNTSQKQRSDITRQIFLPEGGLITKEQSANEASNMGHSLNFSTSANRDSTQMFNLNGSANLNQSHSNNADTSVSANTNGRLLNQGLSQNTNDSKGNSINFDMTWGHRFKKKGRSITINSSLNRSESQSTGIVKAQNAFFDSLGIQGWVDTIRQANRQSDNSNALLLNVDYTEAITKKLFLQWNYVIDLNFQRANIMVTDQLSQGERRNDSLSSIFQNKIGNQVIGFSLQRSSDKWHFNSSIGLQSTLLNSESDIVTSSGIQRNFNSLIGNLSVDRNIGDNQVLTIYYNSDASQPASEQLQPVPDRSDPLNIRYGNPNLSPAHSHSVSMSFQKFHPKKNYSFFSNVEMGYIQNKIMETIVIDEHFVRHYRPQNTPGSWSYSGGINFSQPILKGKISYSLGINGQWNKGLIYLNDRLNTNISSDRGSSATLHISPTDWFNLDFSTNLLQNTVQYSIDKKLNQVFNSQTYSTNCFLKFSKKCYVNSDFAVAISNGRANGFNQIIPIWNFEISKDFLKAENLSISLRANDLLNRNVGLQRNSALNFVEDRKTQALSRYFLLKVSYLFRQM